MKLPLPLLGVMFGLPACPEARAAGPQPDPSNSSERALVQQAYLKAFLPDGGGGGGVGPDNFGTSVAVSGDTAVVGAPREDCAASGVNDQGDDHSAWDSGAAYVFVRGEDGWRQQAYLKASNPGAGDGFGRAVAISGDTIVVGACDEDSAATGVDGDQADNSAPGSGAVYVFVRDGTEWSQQAYLKASNTSGADEEPGDQFGGCVSISGDTLVVGAAWECSAATGVNGDQDDDSAHGAGAAYVFVRDGAGWNQQAYLKGANTGRADSFGRSVSVSGDTVIVGAPMEGSAATGVNADPGDGDTLATGAAYVFVRGEDGWSQQAYLKASNTGEHDSFGTSVSVSGDTAIVGAPSESSAATGINGDETSDDAKSSGAAYVFERDGKTWGQQAYLKASNCDQFDRFGYSVALSGDTAVIGAAQESGVATDVTGEAGKGYAGNSGAAYVFARTAGKWTEQAYLKASNTGSDDQFGRSVAAAEDLVVVGAWREDSAATGVDGDGSNDEVVDSGAAYAFARDAARWRQDAYLKASGTGTGGSGFGGDGLGGSIALAGDTLVAGAPGEDSCATGVDGDAGDDSAPGSGAVWVFGRAGADWAGQAYLKASNTGKGDQFGDSLAISGDTIVVGAPGEDSGATGVEGSMPNSGAVYVFVRQGAGWIQQACLKASNAGMDDQFGCSVAISGDTVIVGAMEEDSSATGVNGAGEDNHVPLSGAAYVFVRKGATWAQQAYLKASNAEWRDGFGFSVALSGDTAVVGAPGEDSKAKGVAGDQDDDPWLRFDSGAAYVFRREGTEWSQRAYLKASNPGRDDHFGWTVAISDDTLVVGSPGESGPPAGISGGESGDNVTGAGAAYVFQRRGDGWSQQACLKGNSQDNYVGFGNATAISGDTLVVGAPKEDGAEAGGRRGIMDAGAAYVFARSDARWNSLARLSTAAPEGRFPDGAEFGASVAIDGETVLVGAPKEGSAATGVNGKQNNSNAPSSGAAYLFAPRD